MARSDYLAIGMVFVLIVLVLMLFKHQRRAAGPEDSLVRVRKELDAARLNSAQRAGLERAVAAAEEATARLERLIAIADDRLARAEGSEVASPGAPPLRLAVDRDDPGGVGRSGVGHVGAGSPDAAGAGAPPQTGTSGR